MEKCKNVKLAMGRWDFGQKKLSRTHILQAIGRTPFENGNRCAAAGHRRGEMRPLGCNNLGGNPNPKLDPSVGGFVVVIESSVGYPNP